MDKQELGEIIATMKSAGTDISTCELKAAGGGLPRSTAETMSAFANTNGGTIICGLSETTFEPVEIDVKAIQNGLANTARNQVHPPLNVDIHVMSYHDKPVVVAEVAELNPREKPCYVKKHGRADGSFVRTGDGDHQMSPYEIDRFMENQARTARYDAEIVAEATTDDFDTSLLNAWLDRARQGGFGRSRVLTDEDLLANRRIIAHDEDGIARPTVAGLMALGAFPQKYFPRLNIVFTSYPATEKAAKNPRNLRYSDSVTIDGPIPDMIVAAIRAVEKNIKHGAVISGSLRENVPDYPLPAVREAVANALMHRDCSPESHGTPVVIELYPDRLDIINPGGLFGSLTVDQLGNRGATLSRNQFLSRTLEDVAYTAPDGTSGQVVENRGTGMPTILNELAEALMEPPMIVSNLNEFRISFKHRSMTIEESEDYSRKNVEEAILAFLRGRTSASTSEISVASGLSLKTVRSYITALLEKGAIEGIGSKHSPQRRYRID